MIIRRIGVPLLIVVVALVLGSVAGAQTGSDDPVSQTRIAKAKKALVSDLEPGLPSVSLDHYLKTEGGADTTIEWETNDCGKQTGDPEKTPYDFPICAQATLSPAGDHKVIVMVTIGTLKTGMRAKPELFRMAVVWGDGSEQPFSKLSEIASHLQAKQAKPPQVKVVPTSTKK